MVGKAIPHFDIDQGSSTPLWVQLRDRFAFLISSGYYEPGEQLPSVRKFAAENQVSLNTVSKTFMALEREGYIQTRHGSGAYVREHAPDLRVSEIEVMTEDFVRSCLDHGMDFDDIPVFVRRVVGKMKSQAAGGEGLSDVQQESGGRR